MVDPVGVLDDRFSEPEAVALTWAEIDSILSVAQLGWLSSVRRNGHPHVATVVPVWHRSALWFVTGEGEQKALNVAANPNVVFTTGRDDWGAGVDVTVQGVAERVFDQATLGDVARGFAQRWDGRWVFELVDGHLEHVSTGPVVLFRVRPKKVIAFGKRPSSQTTFRLS